jgi:hypothetical protein
VAFSSAAWGAPTPDTFGDIYFDRVNNATFDDANGNGIPDFVDIWEGTSTDANGDGVPDLYQSQLGLLEFSLDIGSDSELSDPQVDGDEGFDAGDVYVGRPGNRVGPPGRDGFKDDATIFGGDPWPDPPDPNLVTVVPVGASGTQAYANYFDLDGHDQTDFSLVGASFPVAGPGSPCVQMAEYLIISFDDDLDPGWPTADVPIAVPSPAGVSSYGTTSGQDELESVSVNVAGPPPYVAQGPNPLADELTVHQSLAPNPDNGDPDDDDVDSLDVVEDPNLCSVWFLSVDHEGCLGLDPGSIYEVTPGGPVQVIDDVQHLGLTEDTDVDAFEFAEVEMPSQPGALMLAVLFSVDDDDPLTPGDESGGMDPTAVYVSWCTGSYLLFCPALGDDVDALTVSYPPEPTLGACCFGGFGECVDTTREECEALYFGEWQGPGTDCGDYDGNGLPDACEGGGCPNPGASGNYCSADIDGSGDCIVDLCDLTQLLSHYGCVGGCTHDQGDLNGDGNVNLADLAALLGQYGDNCN